MYGFKNMDVARNGKMAERQDGRTYDCSTKLCRDDKDIGRKTTLLSDESSWTEVQWMKVRQTDKS
jgi:hypothetical protein